jgi:hypothetical protein
MPRYFVSAYLAREATTIYEVHDDGSYWSISPDGHQIQGHGSVPAHIEIDPYEAMRLIAERKSSQEERESKGHPTVGPIATPVERLWEDGLMTDEKRARDEWRKNGWG